MACHLLLLFLLNSRTYVNRLDQEIVNKLKSYLRFEKFIMPTALQFLFWAGIAGTFYGSWWLYVHDNWAWIIALVFGTLLTRLIFEGFILRYQTYIVITEINRKLESSAKAEITTEA
jgi:hypothetical protein